MILKSTPKLEKLEVRFRTRREDRLLQKCEKDHMLPDLLEFRKVVRLQVVWALLFANKSKMPLSELVMSLLRTLRVENWMCAVVQRFEQITCEDFPGAEHIRPSMINDFSYFWRQSICDVFNVENILLVLSRCVSATDEWFSLLEHA